MNHLTLPLAVAFLYFMGAMGGWILEFIFRNTISHKGPKGRYFINPGFCKGPWLPIYGIGIAVLCVLSELVASYINPKLVNTVPATILIIVIMGLAMNVIEFIGGMILLKCMNMRLWDYTDRKWNYKGVVCPLFALIWTIIAAVYYLFIHQFCLERLMWFSKNLAFAFFVGLFFGFFIMDMVGAFQDAMVVKRFAGDKEIVVRYEDLKALMQQRLMEHKEKQHFFHQIVAKGTAVEENLAACFEKMEQKYQTMKMNRR